MEKKKTVLSEKDDQRQAARRLIWGSIVFASGVLGCVGVSINIPALVFIGAILDAVDSVAVARMGGIISAAFFALAGSVVCFAAFSAPWWYGLCAGLCFEGAIGGAIGYGIRLHNFILDKRDEAMDKKATAKPKEKKPAASEKSAAGTYDMSTDEIKRALKRKIRKFIEKL